MGEVADDIADGPFGSNLKAEHYTEEKEARIVQLSNIGEAGWQDENVNILHLPTLEKYQEVLLHPIVLLWQK